MAFPAPADGWVLAAENQPSGLPSGSVLLATRDGGAAWSCQWHRAFEPQQLVATDPEHAWVLGSRGRECGDDPAVRGCTTVVVGTTDGSRWSVLDQPSQAVTQLAFSSPTVGLAAARDRDCQEPGGLPPARCAGQVLLTDDGGRHWRTVLRTRGPVAAVAVARGTFWAVETRLGVSSKFGGKPGLVVLVSHDHGQSWRPAGTISLWLAGLRQHVQLLIGPQRHLWLSAIDLDGCAMHGCSPDDLWQSLDGGRTWRVSAPQDRAESLPGPQCGIVGQIALALDNRGVAWAAAGPNQATCELPAATLSHAEAARTQAAPVTWAVARRWASFRPIALAWPAASVGYALGPAGLAKSTDSGRTWNQVLPTASPSAALNAVSAGTAYAAQEPTDEGAVLATTNGGLRWSVKAHLPVDLTSVRFVSGKVGFAVGAAWIATAGKPSWQVYATGDGGRSWTRRATLPLRSGEQVNGPWMASPKRGLMLVSSGYIWPQAVGGVAPVTLWQTGDGGRTWTSLRTVRLPSRLTVLGGASFAATPDAWAGWMIASPSGLLATVDSGRTWHRLPGAPSLDAVDFVTPSFGIGWSGPHIGRVLLWRSGDGGRHWSRLPLPTGLAANSNSALLPVNASFTNPRVGWLLAAGTVWRTDNGARTWQPASPPKPLSRPSFAPPSVAEQVC